VRLLDEVPPYLDFLFQDEIAYNEKAVHKFLTPTTQPFLQRMSNEFMTIEWTTANIEQVVRTVIAEMDLKSREALLALRVAISGRDISPPLFESMLLLGKTRVLERVAHWI
jgi:glutamyl-tRNA synthetase